MSFVTIDVFRILQYCVVLAKFHCEDSLWHLGSWLKGLLAISQYQCCFGLENNVSNMFVYNRAETFDSKKKEMANRPCVWSSMFYEKWCSTVCVVLRFLKRCRLRSRYQSIFTQCPMRIIFYSSISNSPTDAEACRVNVNILESQFPIWKAKKIKFPHFQNSKTKWISPFGVFLAVG